MKNDPSFAPNSLLGLPRIAVPYFLIAVGCGLVLLAAAALFCEVVDWLYPGDRIPLLAIVVSSLIMVLLSDLVYHVWKFGVHALLNK